MKKSILLILFVFTGLCIVTAQDVFTIRRNARKPKLQSLSSASGDLYAKVGNNMVLTDTSSAVRQYFIMLSGTNNYVSGSGIGFSFSIDSVYINDSVTAFIYNMADSDKAPLCTQKFAVRQIPPTVVAFLGKPIKDSISKSKLLKVKSFGTFVTNDYYRLKDNPYEINSFELVINGKKYCSGIRKNLYLSTLTSSMLKALKKTPLGSTITFQNVTVCRPLAIHFIDGSNTFAGSYKQRKKGLYCWPINSTTTTLVK